MTYRKSLIIGLLAGLSAPPAIVHAAENSAGQQPPPAYRSSPDIMLERSATSAGASSINWQPSELAATTADIRFKKPQLPADRSATTDVANRATTGQPAAHPSRLPAPTAARASTSAPAKIEITDAPALVISNPAVSAPAKQPTLLSELLAPAVEQQKEAIQPQPSQISAVASQQSQQSTASQFNISTATQAAPAATTSAQANAKTNSDQPTLLLRQDAARTAESAEPITQGASEKAELPEVRLTDEQLQLVARILNDSHVVRAAQEEPLPSAPEADPLRGPNGNDSNGVGPEQQHYGDMYYGECCPPQPRLFWVAGVEATFLSPDINTHGRASWAVEDVIEDREEVYTTEDVDSMYLSPRVWIGVQGCAWGANLRYWHLNASESHFDPSVGRDGTWDAFDCGKSDVGFFSMTRLEAYTIDLELTRRFCLHDCAMQGSIGIRHADITYAESITGTALATDANLFGYAEADRYTRGTGLVFGLYGRKPLFPCSCVHWYYNVRWSALWGPTRTAVETGATVLAVGANAGSVNGAYTCVDDNLFIGEIQLGLEWNYALQCVPANAFFRAGVEYQRWTGGMGYSEAGSFAGVEVDNTFEQIGSTFASAPAPELDLIGLTIGTGLTW